MQNCLYLQSGGIWTCPETQGVRFGWFDIAAARTSGGAICPARRAEKRV